MMTMSHHDAHGWMAIHVGVDHLHRHHQAMGDMETAATRHHRDHHHTLTTTTTTTTRGDRHRAVIHAIVALTITIARRQLQRVPVWHADELSA